MKIPLFLRSLSLAAFLALPLAASDVQPLVSEHSFLLEESWATAPGMHRRMSFVDLLEEATDYEISHQWTLGDSAQQLSVTVPLAATGDFAHDPGSEHFGRSVGDLEVACSWEMPLRGARLSVAPGLALVLPTGDADEGYGAGDQSAVVHLPLSMRITSRLSAQTDAEATFHAGGGDIRVGQKVSFLPTSSMTLLLEALYLSSGGEDRLFVGPGLRWVAEHRSGLQVRPGIAIPVAVRNGFVPQVLVYLTIGR